jgi:putative DNA primase/helicase
VDARLTQYGNAQRLVQHYGANIRYCTEYDAWFVWDGARWAESNTVRLGQFAVDTVRRIMSEVPHRARPATDEEHKRDSMIRSWSIQSEKISEIEAMIRGARLLSKVQIRPADFDANPSLLNVANGTVNLRTGKLHTHDRGDYITKISPVRYDADASCPRWEKFLDEVFAGDTALIEYMQRVIGYTLTGDVSEQCLFMLHGASGANGKSTLVETVRALLGSDYCKIVPIETLTREGSQMERMHTVADLCGKRFVTASESEEGEPLREAFIKNITGAEKLQGRRMYQSAFDYDPMFKLWISGNHKLPIRGGDSAIWRRIRMIPFKVFFPEDRRDLRLNEKLRAELPGILAWAVRGAVAWYRHGLGKPIAVRDATDTYQSEQDIIQQFVNECCVCAVDARVVPGELYTAYTKWLQGIPGAPAPLAVNSFGTKLEGKGFTAFTSNGIRYRAGLRLRETPEPEPEPAPQQPGLSEIFKEQEEWCKAQGVSWD